MPPAAGAPIAARDPANGSCYYGWMLQGEALFQDLEPSHPLLTALPITGPGCFETFPHAITWHLRGGDATAANKRAQGSELLEQAGIDLASLTSIDRVDAALCALAAHHAAVGRACHPYGEANSGWIVVPRGQVRREGPARATPTLWALPPQVEQ